MLILSMELVRSDVLGVTVEFLTPPLRPYCVLLGKIPARRAVPLSTRGAGELPPARGGNSMGSPAENAGVGLSV